MTLTIEQALVECKDVVILCELWSFIYLNMIFI